MGHEVEVCTGPGLSPSSAPPPGPSCYSPMQPCFCCRCSHTLMVPAQFALVDVTKQSLTVAATLITPQKQGQVEKPLGSSWLAAIIWNCWRCWAIRTGAGHWKQVWGVAPALAADASTRQDHGIWKQRIFSRQRPAPLLALAPPLPAPSFHHSQWPPCSSHASRCLVHIMPTGG